MSRPAVTPREGWLTLLNTLTLLALTFVLLEQPVWSWAWSLVTIAAAVALLAVCGWPHRRPLAQPMRYPLTLPTPALLMTEAQSAPQTVDAGVASVLSEQVAALAASVNLARQCEELLNGQRATLEHFAALHAATVRSSAYDPLTGLATHTAFMQRLVQDVAFVGQHDRPLALAVFDVIGFRAINLQHGYRTGDEVLAALAERLRLAVDETDLVGRLGGDRFAISWANVDHAAAQARLERVLHLVTRAPIEVPTLKVPVRVELRAGLALCPDDGLAAQALVDLASDALDVRPGRMPHAAAARAPSPLMTPDLGTGLVPDEDAALPTLSAAALPTNPASYLEDLVQRHSGIHALASALEARDPLSMAHARNLAELAEETAIILGRPIEEARLVGLAVLLHDVGELGISPEILQKADPLTPEEWSFVREHPLLGERLLKSVGGVLAAVAPMIAAQRERYDGTGYPEHLAGEVIPLGARIVAVCDVYGALTSDRPYRPAHSVEDALAEIQRCAGTQFDPQVVAAFVQAVQAA